MEYKEESTIKSSIASSVESFTESFTESSTESSMKTDMGSAMGSAIESALIRTEDLKKYYKTSKGLLHAVDNVNISMNKGKTLGVVGESGCGKSTLGRVILRLTEATSGKVFYKDDNILLYSPRQMKKMRKAMQIIFQDPYSSLNPRMSVREIIEEPIKANRILTKRSDVNRRVKELMETVGLAERLINVYPHELDGGRRQRIGIARALSVNPEFIVCDEPVSALDVSIQAQILNLMMDLQESMGLTYLFITHNLSVVKHISNEIAVMYLGQCVEVCESDRLFENPMHPYTQALLRAIPNPDLSSRGQKKILIKGEVTDPIDPEPGCRFAPRCEYAQPICSQTDFKLKAVEASHYVSCMLK